MSNEIPRSVPPVPQTCVLTRSDGRGIGRDSSVGFEPNDFDALGALRIELLERQGQKVTTTAGTVTQTTTSIKERHSRRRVRVRAARAMVLTTTATNNAMRNANKGQRFPWAELGLHPERRRHRCHRLSGYVARD